ncbi:MAG: TonB-dependent receptor [Balneolaceae bacterium]
MTERYNSILTTTAKILTVFVLLLITGSTAHAKQLTALNTLESNQNQYVTVKFNDEPLADALLKLTRQVKVGISYSTQMVPDKRITYQAENEHVHQVLSDMLEGTGLYVTLSNNRKVILIKEKLVQRFIREETVTGIVTDASTGETLPGVNIAIKGTTRGTSTDLDGEFTLTVDDLQEILVFSFIGYQTLEVPLNGRDNISVTLKSASIGLDELVVTGVGVTAEKKTLGQSIATVKASSIENAPVTSVNQALSGRVAGLVAVEAGETGAAAPIRLRGTVSLSQRNGPLVYIDGVRIDTETSGYAGIAISSLSRINPEEIESIEVLKGAAAAALFGTEASAGVIQIFTKSGIDKPTELSFKTTQSFSRTPLDRIPKSESWDVVNNKFVSVNPAKEFFKTGHGQKYDLALSGGTSDYGYYVSGNFGNIDGSLPTTGVKSLGMRTKVNLRPIDGMDIQLGLNSSSYETKVPYPTWGLMGEFVLSDPLIKTEARPYGELYHSIPGILAFDNSLTSRTLDMSAQINYRFLSNFNAHFLIGHVTGDQRYKVHVPPGPDIQNPTGIRTVRNTTSEHTTVEFTLAADLQVSENISSETTVGAQSFWDISRNNNVSVRNFAVADIRVLDGASVISGMSEFFKEVISAGIFAQEKIGFKDRLFLTGGIRMDGNSTFGDSFGFVLYPHAGLSWVLSDEPFWKMNDAISSIRLRSSYGVSGLQPGVFDKLRTWRVMSMLGNKTVIIPNSYGNVDLKPERSEELEIGANVGFLNERIQLDLTYYTQKTSDAILAYQRAPSEGYLNAQLVNIGALKGQGVEVGLNYSAVDNDRLLWDVFATYSKRDQYVSDLGGITPFRASGSARRWNTIMEGYQPGAEIAPVLDPDNSYSLSVPVDQFNNLNQLTPNFIKDADGNDVRRFIGNQLPTTTASFGMTFNLKKYGLSISTLVQGATDFVVHDETEQVRVQSKITPKTARWIRDLSNPATTDQRRQEIADEYINYHPSVPQNWMKDGAYLKLQEVSLTWRIPETITQNKVKGASLTASGRNLLLLTGYDGIIDPGSTSVQGSTNDFGSNIDYFGAPNPRTFEVSLRLSF